MATKLKITAAEQNQFDMFSCVDCTVQLRDVKLLKLHYWKVHIPTREIFNFMKPTDKIKISAINNTTALTVKKTVVSNRKRKLTDSRSASKSQAKRRNETQPDDSLNDVDTTLDSSQRPDVVNSLSSDQIRTFNLKNIDEVELFERFKLSNAARNRNFEEGQIVWAYYRSRIWPACIAKLIKNKHGSINRIAVRYFEHNSDKSAIFKLDPSKVIAFFNPVEAHIQYKQTGAEDMARRLEFLSCYSDALSEFCASLEMKAPTDEPEANKATNFLDKQQSETYFVLDIIMTKEDIVKVAEKELISENQQKTINKREEYSRRLMKVLKSKECQDYIVSILTNTLPCKRQQAYLSGTVKDRKEMNFCSPGPLLIDHQKELAQNLEQLQIAHFPTKPAHLTSFTYDVIYPEAVIWAIKRLDKCTLAKAVSTYKAGFRQTSEEAIKQKCNELLAEWSNQENNNMLAESSVNSTDSIENESSLSLNNTAMSDISASVADAIDLIVERIEKQHFKDLDLPELEF